MTSATAVIFYQLPHCTWFYHELVNTVSADALVLSVLAYALILVVCANLIMIVVINVRELQHYHKLVKHGVRADFASDDVVVSEVCFDCLLMCDHKSNDDLSFRTSSSTTFASWTTDAHRTTSTRRRLAYRSARRRR